MFGYPEYENHRQKHVEYITKTIANHMPVGVLWFLFHTDMTASTYTIYFYNPETNINNLKDDIFNRWQKKFKDDRS